MQILQRVHITVFISLHTGCKLLSGLGFRSYRNRWCESMVLTGQRFLSGFRTHPWFRRLCGALVFFYCAGLAGRDLSYAQSPVAMPPAGVLLEALAVKPYSVLQGISVDPHDPFKINFLADAGEGRSIPEEQAQHFIKYFLAFLTIPEKDLWVNLSPAEPDRIVNLQLGETAAGQDLLREDYVLKQLAASLTHPDGALGKSFWREVYAKVREQYGDISIPLDTFSRVWVVPGQSVVYEQDGSAFISESHLKVLLDQDHQSLQYLDSGRNGQSRDDNMTPGSETYVSVARDIIVPAIEREVNEGQHFIALRQMHHALILAVWFKRKLKDSIVNRLYADRQKLAGIQINEKDAARKVYEQYMVALKKGVFDFIREEFDPVGQEMIPRRYFSGGLTLGDVATQTRFLSASLLGERLPEALSGLGRNIVLFSVALRPRGDSADGNATDSLPLSQAALNALQGNQLVENASAMVAAALSVAVDVANQPIPDTVSQSAVVDAVAELPQTDASDPELRMPEEVRDNSQESAFSFWWRKYALTVLGEDLFAKRAPLSGQRLRVLTDILRRQMKVAATDETEGSRGILVTSLFVKGTEKTNFIKAHLIRWRETLVGWSNKDFFAYSQEDVLQKDLLQKQVLSELNGIMNNAYMFIRKTAFLPSLISKDMDSFPRNVQYRNLLTDFNFLAMDTLEILSGYLSSNPALGDKDRNIILRDIRQLHRMRMSVVKYLLVLEFRAVVDKVISYKLDKNHWMEHWWFPFAPFIRWVLMDQYRLERSVSQLERLVPELLELQNEIIPDLYGDEQERRLIAQQGISGLHEMIEKADSLFPMMGASGRKINTYRSLLSRAWRVFYFPVIVFFANPILTVLNYLFALNLPMFSAGIITASGLGIFGLSLALFWVVAHFNVKAPDLRTMSRVLEDQYINFINAFGGSQGSQVNGDSQSARVKLGVMEGLESQQRERNMKNAPSVDMILFIPGKKEYVSSLEAFVAERKDGSLFRPDVPLFVVPPNGTKGSMNAYFDSQSYAKQMLQDPGVLREYPRLRGIAERDLNVLIVFRGDDANQEDIFLEWAVINGYRMSQKMMDSKNVLKNHAGWRVVVYSRDVFLGTIPPYVPRDVNILTSFVRKKDLKSLGFMIMKHFADGFHVRTVHEKRDFDELRKEEVYKPLPSEVLRHLDEEYGLAREEMRHLPAYTGMVSFGPRVVRILDKLKDSLEPYRKQYHYLHMTMDGINLLVKPIGEILQDHYLDARVKARDFRSFYKLDDGEQARTHMLPFFKMFVKAREEAIGDDLVANPVMPHQGAAAIVFVNSPQTRDRARKLLKEGGVPDFRNPQETVLKPRAVLAARQKVERVLPGQSSLARLQQMGKSDHYQTVPVQEDLLRLSSLTAGGLYPSMPGQGSLDSLSKLMAVSRVNIAGRSLSGQVSSQSLPSSNADSAQTDEMSVNGGLDLSAAAQSIAFMGPATGAAGQGGIDPVLLSRISGRFTGFDFEILNLQPVADPLQFFRIMMQQ